MATSGREKYGDAIEPIAIVGMACRFPGDVSTPGQFWDLLENQRSGHSEVPADRFKGDVWRHPDFDRRGAIQPSSGFFLSQDVSLFDAPFFSITAKEAMGMDPMQRQLLEIAYECFENAGVPMEKLPGSSTSVYTGVMTGDYERMTQGDIFHLPLNAASGTSKAMLSNRLSWFFNLAGPSLTLDTACSSSLYALHLACQSIRLGESKQALVAGVNLILDPIFIAQLSSMHMLSPDGVSHSFDDRANGYARGESVGAVLVKPLRQALADGDTIRAVIRGSGANQDGKTPGITMPSRDAQGNLIEAVYSAAGLSMAGTNYFEAHGTGTKIGDPIELSAIGQSLGAARPKGDRLYVGSVKTNVGHTEGMAGLAGVIKSTLALEKAVLPGLVGFEKLNPRLLLDDWNLALPLESMPWPTTGLRRASVNSFGFGGANAHVILDDAYHYLQSHNLEGRHYTLEKSMASTSSSPAQISNCEISESDNYKLLPFSMQDQSGIDRLSKSLTAYLTLDPSAGERPEIDMDDLAFTLADRRSQFNIRSFSVSQSVKHLAKSGLKSLASLKQKQRGQAENLIFVFSGQGAQWPLMGRELMSRPVFAESMARSQQYLDELGCTWDAVEILRDPGPKINAAEFCQPMCTILQVALVDLLASWDIYPYATIGHSSGEMGAAYAAGAIDQKATVKIGYMRGYYCAQLPSRLKEKRGCMMAAGLTPQEAEKYLRLVDEGAVVVACINSPVSVTLSGDMDGISYLEAQIQADGKFARKLRVEVAYHSPHMREVSQDFLESLGDIETATKFKALMFSSVTTKEVEHPSVLDAAYWVKNMVSAVHFSEAADSLLNHSIVNAKTKKKTFVNWFAALELGPHEALKGPFNQCVSNLKGKRSKETIPYVSMIRRGEPGDKTAAEAAGLLWSLGHPIDILKVNNVKPDRVMKPIPFLPPYPWQHNKGFWIEPRNHVAARMKSSPRTDLLGIEIDNQNPHEPHWKNVMSLTENPWMRDHTITGTVLYPAAGMLVMALEAVLQIAKSQERKVRGVEFHDVRFDRGLVIPDTDDAVETSLSIKPHEMLESWFHWTLFSRVPGGTYQRHAWGLISLVDDGESEGNKIKGSRWQVEAARFSSVRTRAMSSIDTTAFYDQLRTIGMDYGPMFTNLTSAAAVENENAGYGVIAVPDTKSVMPGDFEYPHVIHPATLDAIFHLLFVALFEGKPMPESSIPVTVEKIFIATDQPSGSGAEYVGFSTAKKINDRDYSGSLVTSDAEWQAPKVIVNNMVIRKVSSSDDSSMAMQMATVPKRVGEMHWMEDLDLLDVQATNRVIEQRAKQQTDVSKAVTWLELACHKHPSIKALAVVDDTKSGDLVAEVISGFAPSPGSERKFSKMSVKATTEDVYFYLSSHPMLRGLDIDIGTMEPVNETSPAPKGESKYDLLIVHVDTQDRLVSNRLADLAPKLETNGNILAFGLEVEHVESHLQKNGFETPSARSINDTGSLLVVSRPRKARASGEDTIYVLQSPKPSSKVTRLRKSIDEAFAKSDITLETRLLSEIAPLKGQQFISLLEVEDPLVMKWSAEQFGQFRDLVFSQSYVLWVTRGGYLERGDDSLEYAPTTGLLRTMRTEIPQIVMPHLDLSPSIDLESPLTASLIVQIVEKTMDSKTSSGEDIETEYVECNGVCHVPRILGDAVLDGELNAHAELPTPVPTPLSKRRERPLHFVPKGTSSSLAEYQWVEDVEATTAIGDDQVEIITEYVAVDAAGMGGTRGTTPKESMGQTASGSVSRIGADVQEINIGDKVFFPVLEGRALRTQLRQQRNLVNRVPSGVPLADAPRLLNSVVNAYHCLHNVARIGQAESVLLHMLNHDLAYAAFSIAKVKGAKVFHSVESKEVQETLIDQYHVAEHRIFDSTSSDLAQNLLDATNGRGFDVILSDYTGVSRRQASACVAENGQYVDLSGNFVVGEMSMDVFDKNVSISSNDVWRLRQTALGDLFQDAAKLLSKDDSFTRAPRGSVFSVGSLNRAWEHMNELFHSSLTIHFNDGASISAVPPKPAPLSLDPNATYIIAGGLGALGLAIAEDMASNGARHLVLLSRSGVPKTSRQQKGVDSMKDQGCKVDTLACDVSDEEQVRNMIKTGKERGWSVKGLIQCAMVLYDCIFENMKYEDWVNSLRPKVRGTWYLHTHLPQNLDFFIILSSMSGIIGNAAQANYAAGNNYEDAIAHYRHVRGLASTTINAGMVTDASHFEADVGTFNMTSEEWLQNYPHWAPAIVTVRELQLVLNAVMRGDTPVPAQIQVGINGEVPRGPESMNPWSKERKFDHRIKKQTNADSSGEGPKVSLANELDAADSGQDVVSAITHALKAHVAAAMTASPEDIDSEKPLYSFGIDSLKAINVRNWVFKEVKADVSVFDILSPTPLGQLAVNLAKKSSLVRSELAAMIEKEGY